VVATVDAVHETPRDTLDNVDSPAVWHGPDGQHWLLATAKETDVVVVSDAATGEVQHRFGGEGEVPGRMDRPNGIAVVDDLVFIVERDNARVQVFALPGFQSLGVYGGQELRKPYGIAVISEGDGEYSTYITDNYEFEEDVVPPDSMLGQRVRHYRVTVAADAVTAALANTFGDTAGAGVLRVVESIAADPAGRRLLVAEEQEGGSMIKVYDRDGRFTGEIIDQRFFPNEAEGIALYDCADGGGYWIATDQSQADNTFHVFDRRSLGHLGSFRGRTVRNTDGVALTQVPFDGFPAGAFFAVHDDGNVAAIRWESIATPLDLRADCVTPGSGP
jgi:3-phytase